eukprot:m.134768 g.134768  ORF g.134768 m.134768 type:complete len:406 (+) comp9726_c0_seq1:33-1250(+)
MMAKKVLIIAGDIGGTNSRLAMFKMEKSQPLSEKTICDDHEEVFTRYYKNEGFQQFQDVIAQFLEDVVKEASTNVDEIASACFAVAGPVMNNAVVMTNRSWAFNGVELGRRFNISSVRLINDFAANGYGLLTLAPSEYQELQEGEEDATAPIGLIGAGTGLGECFLTSKNGVYDAFPCEGGHVEFAPRSELEVEMLQFLYKKYGRVSVERIVSGKGIINVYEFLVERFPKDVNQALHDKIMNAPEPAKVISTSAHDYKLAFKAMEMMMTAYGAETGNMGLKLLPQGSIYICGGIAPHNIEFMSGDDTVFMKAFKDKGRVASVLHNVPIRLVRSEDLGLRGAHVVSARLVIGVSSSTPSSSSSSAVFEESCKQRCGGVCAPFLATIALTSLTAAFAGAAFFKLLSK